MQRAVGTEEYSYSALRLLDVFDFSNRCQLATQ